MGTPGEGAQAAVRPSATVLVIDDPDVGAALAVALECEGYCVAVANRGVDGLAYLAGHLSPDLVLLGAALPDLDAAALVRYLRADPRWVHLPVVVCGAPEPWPWKADVRDGPPLLAKPFGLSTLLAVVGAHCRS